MSKNICTIDIWTYSKIIKNYYPNWQNEWEVLKERQKGKKKKNGSETTSVGFRMLKILLT